MKPLIEISPSTGESMFNQASKAQAQRAAAKALLDENTKKANDKRAYMAAVANGRGDQEMARREGLASIQETEKRIFKDQGGSFEAAFARATGQPVPSVPQPAPKSILPPRGATPQDRTVNPLPTSSIKIDAGKPLEIKVSVDSSKATPEVAAITGEVVQSEIAKFKVSLSEELQRSMDAFAKNNKLIPTVNPASVA